MNPIKELLSLFDRLINEHGSTPILRDRIALAVDQYSFLERQMTALQKEHDKLTPQLQACQTNLEKSHLENDRLKKELADCRRHIEDLQKGDDGFSSGAIISDHFK